MTREIRLPTMADPRLTEIKALGGGEGFGTYVGRFEGKPAFIVDSGTMAAFIDEEEALGQLVSLTVFESEAARDEYLEDLMKRVPGAVGRWQDD